MARTETWSDATNLVALDLEGSGAQDGDDEAILEIAAVRIRHGIPAMATAFSTVVDPQRPIPHHPWISPGLSGTALTGAPTFADVQPGLCARLDGVFLVGHNVGVDWRLLQRRCPGFAVTGLIDTWRVAKSLPDKGERSLTALLARYELTDAVTALAPNSRPHRALWDAVGAALLLKALVKRRWNTAPTLRQLLAVAGPVTRSRADTPPPEQDRLFG